MHLHLEHTDLVCDIFLSSAHELDLVTRLDRAVDDLEICDDTSEGVEDRVEDKGLERSFRITRRSRNPLHDSVEHVLYTFSCLSGSQKHILRLAAQKIHHLVGDDLYHCRFNIDLVEDRYDFEVMFYCEIKV